MPEAMEDLTAMKRLWVHEVLRVYGDRLVDDNDRDWLVKTLHTICHDNLLEDLDVMFSHLADGNDTVASVLFRKLANVFYTYKLNTLCLT